MLAGVYTALADVLECPVITTSPIQLAAAADTSRILNVYERIRRLLTRAASEGHVSEISSRASLASVAPAPTAYKLPGEILIGFAPPGTPASEVAFDESLTADAGAFGRQRRQTTCRW